MKLYVWADPYCRAYGGTMVFAVAKNLREARKIAETAPEYAYAKYERKGPGASVKLGEPTRVVSLPCAEWHYWEE